MYIGREVEKKGEGLDREIEKVGVNLSRDIKKNIFGKILYA